MLPAFTDQEWPEVDLGPLENFPRTTRDRQWHLEEPALGEVSRRTAYIRNNGERDDGLPSFTILFSRCVHLGCPVQPNGPVEDEQRKEYKNTVVITPTQPSGFSRLCHGGAYDTEGRRTAGPPVRSMDRYQFGIKEGNLFVGKLFSVGTVEGRALTARMTAYGRARSRRSRGRHRGLALPDRGAAIATRSKPSPMKTALLYPLDWLDERSGLVGGVKYFLFRRCRTTSTGCRRSAPRA